MFNLNYCFECGNRTKPRSPLSKPLLKIYQANRTMNLRMTRFINQLIDQRFKDYGLKRNSHE